MTEDERAKLSQMAGLLELTADQVDIMLEGLRSVVEGLTEMSELLRNAAARVRPDPLPPTPHTVVGG